MKKLILSLTLSAFACACTLQAADAVNPKATADKGKEKAACAAKADACCCSGCCGKIASKPALLPPRAAALFVKPVKAG